MAFKDALRGVIKDLAETRIDDGRAATARTMVDKGISSQGVRLLGSSGGVVLRDGESVLGRANFKRLGVAVLYAPAVTSANRKILLDVEQTVDLTVTDQRVVVVYDDLSTKGRWDGDGLGKVVAVAANVAHAIGSNIIHHGEAAVFEVEIEQLNRVLAPSVPTFSWSRERSVTFGWQEPRNLGIGDMRIVLLDQRNEDEHLEIGGLLFALVTGDKPSGHDISWARQ